MEMAKCMAKLGHLKTLIYKGSSSQYAPEDEVPQKVVTANIKLAKLIHGQDPFSIIQDQGLFEGVEVPVEIKVELTNSTISLSSWNEPDSITYGELSDWVGRIEGNYEVASKGVRAFAEK